MFACFCKCEHGFGEPHGDPIAQRAPLSGRERLTGLCGERWLECVGQGALGFVARRDGVGVGAAERREPPCDRFGWRRCFGRRDEPTGHAERDLVILGHEACQLKERLW